MVGHSLELRVKMEERLFNSLLYRLITKVIKNMWEHLVQEVKEDNFFLGFLDKTFKGRSWNGLESK